MTKQTDSDTDPHRKHQPSFKTNATPDQQRSPLAGVPDPIQTLVTNLEEEVKELVAFGTPDPIIPSQSIKLLTWLFDELEAKVSSTEHALRELIESVRMGSEQDLTIDWEDFEKNASANTRLDIEFEGIKDTVFKLITNEIGWFLPPTDVDRNGYSFSKQFALLNYGVQPSLSQERIGRLLGGASQSAISRLSVPVNRLLEINSILYDELERSAPISIADPLEESIQRYRRSYRSELGGGGAKVDRTITPVALIKDDRTALIFSVSFVCMTLWDGIGSREKHLEDVENKIESAIPTSYLYVPYIGNSVLDEMLENENYQINQHIVCFSVRRGHGKSIHIEKPVYVAAEPLGGGFDGNYVMEISKKEASMPAGMSLREIFDNYNRAG